MKLILIFFLFITYSAHANIMNLNEFMPTRLEDASGADKGEWNFQMSSFFREKDDQDQILFRPNVRYGLTERIQLEAFSNHITGGEEGLNGATWVGGLFQLIKSQNASPEFAIQPMLILPSGKGSSGHDYSIKTSLTSTLKGTPDSPEAQVHLNVNWLHNNQRENEERIEYFEFSFGYSHKLTATSMFVVDVIHEQDSERYRNQNTFEAGFKYEFLEKSYLGLGLNAGLGGDSPAWGGILSLETHI